MHIYLIMKVFGLNYLKSIAVVKYNAGRRETDSNGGTSRNPNDPSHRPGAHTNIDADTNSSPVSSSTATSMQPMPQQQEDEVEEEEEEEEEVEQLPAIRLVTGPDGVLRGVTAPTRHNPSSIVGERSTAPEPTDYGSNDDDDEADDEGKENDGGTRRRRGTNNTTTSTAMTITCPVTGETFDFGAIRQVYIA